MSMCPYSLLLQKSHIREDVNGTRTLTTKSHKCFTSEAFTGNGDVSKRSHSLFTVLRPAEEFFTLYGDVTIAGEGLQNLGLCLTLKAFEQGGIFIVPQLL
jgi:hypothetical protein